MKKKEIIICILAIIMLVISVSNVFALDGNLDEIDDNDLLPITNDDDNLQLNPDNNSTTLINNNSGIVNKDDAILVTNNTLNTNIPNTGITDTPIIPIVICVISAVVAYTQIRKYNV